MKCVGGAEVLPILEADLQKIAMRVVEKAKKICASKQVMILTKRTYIWDITEPVSPILQGNARNVLFEANIFV